MSKYHKKATVKYFRISQCETAVIDIYYKKNHFTVATAHIYIESRILNKVGTYIKKCLYKN